MSAALDLLFEHNKQLEKELLTKTQQLEEAKKHLKLVLEHNGINTLGRIKIEQFLEDVEL